MKKCENDQKRDSRHSLEHGNNVHSLPYLVDVSSKNYFFSDPDAPEGFDDEKIGREIFLRFLDETIERADRLEADRSNEEDGSDQT